MPATPRVIPVRHDVPDPASTFACEVEPAAPSPASLLAVIGADPTRRASRRRVLEQAGYEVLDGSIDAAVELVRVRRPRLVLLDAPLADARDLRRRLAADPDTAPVLVLRTAAVDADTGAPDSPIAATALVATVRALVRARDAEDALGERDELLATLSHDLRSPLSAILMWTALLRSGRLDASRAEQALEAVERSARLQLRLVDDVLDVSRVLSGRMALDVAPIDATSVVEAALESVRVAAEKKGVVLSASVAASSGRVSGDAARLQQAIRYLLSGAIACTPPGGQVETRVEHRGGQVWITVTDAGQGEPVGTRAYHLEVAIARHLVTLHGGTIETRRADDGRGTASVVRLPLPSAPPGIVPSAEISGMPTVPLAGVHVLVVDDQPDARDAIATVLELSGARVTAVSSVADAVARVAADVPDAVVTDIGMPAEDGFALLAHLRGHGATRHLRALALTGHAAVEDRQRILAAGFDAYLAKPIDATELVAAVARLARPPRV